MPGWSLDETRRFLNESPAASVVLDDERRVVVANAEARALLGIAEGAQVALPTRASAETPRTDQRQVLGAGGEPFLASVAWRGVSLAGARHTLVHVVPIRGEARLHALESRDLEVLRHGTAIAGLGIFEHDHLTDAVWISPEMREIYGWPADKAATLHALIECAHPDDGERVGTAVARAHDPSGDGRCDVEGRLFRPDGELRWVRTRSRTYFEGEGSARRPSRTIGAIVDLTESKRVTEARGRLISVLDETPDLVAIVDAQGRTEYANPAVRAFFELTSDRIAAASLLGDSPAARDLSTRAVPEALATGRARAEIELLDGRSLSVVLLAHRGPAGVTHFSAIARDTTALRRLEEQFRQAHKMEAVGRLAGGIAHDFNNILSVILSCAELALADLPEAHPVRLDLEQISAGAARAAQLTQQLLAFSRRQVLRPRTIDPATVVAAMEPLLRRLVGEDVAFASVFGEPRAHILCDPTQLEQVLLNLVVNARDALPRGGKITLETALVVLDDAYVAAHAESRSGPHVMLAVSDDGVGMDAATRAQIFEPFFTTKGPGVGTGLGLSTVYGIVRQSGGTVWVYSEPGCGTTFKLFFPVATGDAEQPAPRTAARFVGAARKPGARILLVEDDPAVRRVVRQVLERAGYVVTEAATPAEALTIGADGVALMLTDVVMPDMTGRQLADQLVVKHPGLRVLYMSGYTENSVVHHGVLEAGIDFLPKPILPTALLDTIEAVLAR
ncbi:MAG: response regulator [Deltaproteobacteria bacterium]|nr:response regulator [Deltaproteobacteria bacterium]